MFFSSAVALAAVAGIATASPIEKRVATPTVNDYDILNYALTLEYLERAFYRQGTSQFTQADFVSAGFADPFYANLQTIYTDEQTHVTVLSSVLGDHATKELTYSFPFTDAKSFVTLSSVLEGVGVSAYLGAAASIAEPAYLTAAGSILTVEARHSAYIRSMLLAGGESPFPEPFDTPLDFNQVFSLAASFITSLSGSAPLPFQAFPGLTPECTQYYYESDRSPVTFSGAFTNAMKFDASITSSTPIYAVFFSGLSKIPVQVRITQGSKDYKIDTIPAGIAGQVYVMLGRSATSFTDEDFIAGPAILEVFPKGHIPSVAHAKCH